MKIKYVLLLVLSVQILAIHSQDNSVGKIEYNMSFLLKNYKTKLTFNNSKSIFTYENMNREFSETTDDDGNINIISVDTTTFVVYNDLKKRKLYHYLSLFSSKKHDWVEESTPVFLWKLLEETKKIGNITCYKASSSFRGRNYTAWYTPTIKSSFGPWKFQGLPGLILEIYDEDKEVNITTKKITIPFVEEMDVKPTEIILFEDVKKTRQKKIDDFIQKLESKQERGVTIKVKVHTSEGIERE